MRGESGGGLRGLVALSGAAGAGGICPVDGKVVVVAKPSIRIRSALIRPGLDRENFCLH